MQSEDWFKVNRGNKRSRDVLIDDKIIFPNLGVDIDSSLPIYRQFVAETGVSLRQSARINLKEIESRTSQAFAQHLIKCDVLVPIGTSNVVKYGVFEQGSVPIAPERMLAGCAVDFARVPPNSPFSGPFTFKQFVQLKDLDVRELVCLPNEGLEEFGERLRYFSAKSFLSNSRVRFVGGDHALTYFPVKLLSEHLSDLVVIQFDAHTDLDFEHEERLAHHNVLNHANVATKICLDAGISKLIQIGVRDKAQIEINNFSLGRTSITQIPDVLLSNSENWLDEIIEQIRGRAVYLSFDMDVFSPNEFPSVTTPFPTETPSRLLVDLARKIAGASGSLVGADMVEFCYPNHLNSPELTKTKKLLQDIAEILFL